MTASAHLARKKRRFPIGSFNPFSIRTGDIMLITPDFEGKNINACDNGDCVYFGGKREQFGLICSDGAEQFITVFQKDQVPLLAKRPDTGKCLVVGRSLEVVVDFEHVVPGKGEIYGLPGILSLIKDNWFVTTHVMDGLPKALDSAAMFNLKTGAWLANPGTANLCNFPEWSIVQRDPHDKMPRTIYAYRYLT